MNNRTEAKLKDLSGMQKAVSELLYQAWKRGYKYCEVDHEERPQGEWIEVTRRISDSETATYWECSICKEHDRKDGKSKFCCECGAKMKGGDRSETDNM